jgi:hypothetical protein
MAVPSECIAFMIVRGQVRMGAGRGAGVGHRSHSLWKRLTLVLAMVVTGISVIGYVALSVTVNGLPPLRVFPGWLAVLEPVSEVSGEQVSLMVQSDAVGSHPLVSYTVVACGSHPYSADLLIGGSAQLAGIRQYPPQFAALVPALRVQRLPDLMLAYGSGPANYGPVQLVHVSLPQVACLPAAAGQGTAGSSGAAEGIEGYAGAPFQQSWRAPWGWWAGPHATQDWPLTGALPQTTAYGAFTGLSGLSGQWIRPDATIEISTLNPSLDQSIDSAIPEPSDPELASWTGADGMNPVARLTSTSSVALLQDWIVVFAVGFGVGGGMLASLLLEWLRPGQEAPRPVSNPAYPKSPGSPGRLEPPKARKRRPDHGGGALITAAFIIGWAFSRRSRH